MKHHYTSQREPMNHWAVALNGVLTPNSQNDVLVQIQAGDEQVRLGMSAEHAEELAQELLLHAKKARELKNGPDGKRLAQTLAMIDVKYPPLNPGNGGQ